MKPSVLLVLSMCACTPTVGPTNPGESAPAAVAPVAAPTQTGLGTESRDTTLEEATAPVPQRAQTICATLGVPAPANELIGARFGNAAARMPGGLSMKMEAAVGDEDGLGSWSLVAAMRGTSLLAVVARLTALDPPTYEIVEALDLGVPCEHLILEAGTCDLDGRFDSYVFALMDEQYQCGGHGESTPALAWSLREGHLERVNPHRVTCGSLSCEVDPPPPKAP